MRVFNLSTLRQWQTKHSKAASALQSWYDTVTATSWTSIHDMKMSFPQADFITIKGEPDTRVVFDILGNNYRLVAHVAFRTRFVFLKAFLTHAEYSRLKLDKHEF